MTYQYMVHIAYTERTGRVSAATATLVQSTKTLEEMRKAYEPMVLANYSRFVMVIDIIRVD